MVGLLLMRNRHAQKHRAEELFLYNFQCKKTHVTSVQLAAFRRITLSNAPIEWPGGEHAGTTNDSGSEVHAFAMRQLGAQHVTVISKIVCPLPVGYHFINLKMLSALKLCYPHRAAKLKFLLNV
jgi:hypothetical protein